MRRNASSLWLLSIGLISCASVTQVVHAATPSAAQALALKPIQKAVDFELPTGDAVDECKVEAVRKSKMSGWIVLNGKGQILRRFVDTNGDNKIDHWCYYKEGVEIYRDLDADFNGKADQYRWMGTAGIRWGLDENEDGRIDSWKSISPEELTAEIVGALASKDAARFKRLLITEDELKSLGLGKEQHDELLKRVSEASSAFSSASSQQTVVKPETLWIHFGGHLPALVPEGTNGSTKDLILYENVTAVVETDGKHDQLSVGTLIQVDGAWRAIDLPQDVSETLANRSNGFLLTSNSTHTPTASAPSAGGLSEATQELMIEFEKVEKQIVGTTSSTTKRQLNERRAELLERLIESVAAGEERTNWIRQYADTVSAAAQSGEYPNGIERLESFAAKLAKSSSADGAGYVKFRFLSARYSQDLQKSDADYAKVQEQWLKDLDDFVKEFPTSSDAADAMLQLALAREFAGEETDAKEWYARIVKEFPSSALAKKAAGAQRRLESVGKTIPLRGRSVAGKSIDLSAYRGKHVLIHYWATWCEPCKEEFTALKTLRAKYGKSGFELIGVSLDSDEQALRNYLRQSPLSWPQLYEEGGLESRYANELGILTLPTMVLVDDEGKVINRGIHVAEVDDELKKRLR